MLEYFRVIFLHGESKLGVLNLNTSNLEEVMGKTLKEYLTNQNLREIDIKIRKINVLLDNSEFQTPEVEGS